MVRHHVETSRGELLEDGICPLHLRIQLMPEFTRLQS